MIQYDITHAAAELSGVFHSPLPVPAKTVMEAVRQQRDRQIIGFYLLHHQLKEQCRKIDRVLGQFPDDIDTFLLIGIGGSSLGPQALHDALAPHPNRRFLCLDNIDPTLLNTTLAQIDPTRTVVNVISKSGGTTETMLNFFAVYRHFKSVLGDRADRHVLLTTDPTSGKLRALADGRGFLNLTVPSNVGGRFSVFSSVGLAMARFMGYDTDAMADGMMDLDAHLLDTDTIETNPALAFAAYQHRLAMVHGYPNVVLMPYVSRLATLTAWFKQLWAESLGKRINRENEEIHVGQTPVSAVGAIDQHSLVQLFIEGPKDRNIVFIKLTDHGPDLVIENPFIELDGFDIFTGHRHADVLNAELDATSYALAEAGIPVSLMTIPKLDAYHLAQLIYFFEVSTAISGELYNINAFDQPGVEHGKVATRALLGDKNHQSLRDKIQSKQ